MLVIKKFTAVSNGGSGLRINGENSLSVSCPKCGSQDVQIEDLAIVNNAPVGKSKITCLTCGFTEKQKSIP